ncbi:MAG: recombination mediator RecR [Bacteroidales bacterium]|jgi:recombination protein RecR|nr:recombination mediator RecR [Bacteroidales bacterium]
MENYSSVLLENAVAALNKLPGIGKKTALRQALFLLSQDKDTVRTFCAVIEEFKNNTVFCKVCHNISDTETCTICANPKRDISTVCVVSDIRDVMAIENTGTYFGLYHVLGGLISPMDGISPSQLNIEALIERVRQGGGSDGGSIKEIIFAFPATPEGDTTAFYITRKLADTKVLITAIAKGISIGDELEYADEVTLSRSIAGRVEIRKES